MLLVNYNDGNFYSKPILKLIDKDKEFRSRKSYFMDCLDFYCHLKILTNKYLGRYKTEFEKYSLQEELNALCQKYNIGIIPMVIENKEEKFPLRKGAFVNISFVKSSPYIDEDMVMTILTFIESKINNLKEDNDKAFQLYLYQLLDSSARLEFNLESGVMELIGNIKDFKASRIFDYLVDKETFRINDLSSDFHNYLKSKSDNK